MRTEPVLLTPQQQCAWSIAEDWAKLKHVDMQNQWIQDASKSGRVHHEEGRHVRESSRFDDEAAAENENRTTDEPHGFTSS